MPPRPTRIALVFAIAAIVLDVAVLVLGDARLHLLALGCMTVTTALLVWVSREIEK